MEKIFFHPTWKRITSYSSVEACEDLLGKHFGGECVVTGSGRSAIDILMRYNKLSRYSSRVSVTPMISRCVLDVTVNHAYPVDPSKNEKHDLVLRYHQMGLPQKDTIFTTPVIEDICHSFFLDLSECSLKVGKRWAVFSLPKFFPIAGMAGGIVVEDKAEASELRKLRDLSALITDSEQRLQSEEFQLAYGGDPHYSDRLEMVYLKRRLNSKCHPMDIAGFPLDLHELNAVRLRRNQVMTRLLEPLYEKNFPYSWYGKLGAWLPFALPIFLCNEERMNKVALELNSQGIQSGVYSIDIARNQTAPNFKRAVVVPCHHQLSDRTCEIIISTLMK